MRERGKSNLVNFNISLKSLYKLFEHSYTKYDINQLANAYMS